MTKEEKWAKEYSLEMLMNECKKLGRVENVRKRPRSAKKSMGKKEQKLRREAGKAETIAEQVRRFSGKKKNLEKDGL